LTRLCSGADPPPFSRSDLPRAIDGRVRIVLKRLSIEAMPPAIAWSEDRERRFADVPDSFCYFAHAWRKSGA
jgi:hypothetical protein